MEADCVGCFMAKYALVKAGVVQTIITTDQDISAFPDIADSLVSCDDTVQCNWKYDGVNFTSEALPITQVIENKINSYRAVASELVVELYVQNTLAGITTAQSDQMFDDFDDVLTRIREGAFPTALYRLATKTPSGFVTQQLLDSWAVKITSYL